MSEKKAFLGEASVDTRFVADAMKKTQPGETISYETLNAACGRDVRAARHLIESARRILLRDHSMVFRCVPNEGYIRLEDEKIVEVANTDRREKMRRQAAAAIKELGCVKYDSISETHKASHNTGMALFGSLYQATSKQSVKKLHERVANAGGQIDVTGTLKLIGWLGN